MINIVCRSYVNNWIKWGMKLNRTMLKILIATLILLIGAGAVSAIDNNSTDEVVSVEQTEEISVIEDNEVISVNESNNEVLSVENNDTVISVSGNDSEVLTADNNTVISVSENNSDVLSVENTNSVISVSSDDDLTASSPFAKDPQMTQSKTQYKTIYLGKMKFLKKYKKMLLYGYKTPSKKNKKAWKKHIAFQKAVKKQFKQWKKNAYKIKKYIKNNHWKPLGSNNPYYKIKYSGKYINMYLYAKCYRTYNYNPLLNKGWWD